MLERRWAMPTLHATRLKPVARHSVLLFCVILHVMRVFILGAGFSKSAGMPLATELTELLIGETIRKHNLEEMSEWVEGLQERLRKLENNGTATINIEQFFHFANFDAEIWRMRQHLCPVGREYGDTPWQEAESIEAWLIYFEEDLVRVLWEKQQKADGKYITQFVKHLNPTDIVLTFNYDTLLENSLSSCNCGWHHGLNDSSCDSIAVLKLHGSIDWIALPRGTGNLSKCTRLFSKDDTNAKNSEPSNEEYEYHLELYRVKKESDLKQSIQAKSANNRIFGLAGLGSYKPLHRLPGSGMVWAKASEALITAEEIYIIGFSLSAFDALAQLYFVEAIQQRDSKKPLKITLVDPNGSNIVDRFRVVFGNDIFIEEKRSEEVDWNGLLSV